MDNSVESTDFFRTFSGEQDFYVLKFPSKLWKIVNDCHSGAIRWGPFGKTILINYNLFPSEFLQCRVPKFKTRNMTSFVRQLNMYGFKKMQQTQNKLSRFYNIHEFFHENFRYGRPDLLTLVKRRAIPLKFPKTQNYYDMKSSRLDMCRNTFEESLFHSNEFRHFWKLSPQLCSSIGEGDRVIKPVYRIRIIPAQDIQLDDGNQELTAVVSRDYEKVLNRDPEVEIEEPPESDYENKDFYDEVDPLLLDSDFAPTTAEELFILNEGLKGIPVQVKNGFDGSSYIIDIMESTPREASYSVNPCEFSKNPDPIETSFNSTLIKEDSPVIVPEEEAAPTIHLPENDDLFACLSSAISGVEM